MSGLYGGDPNDVEDEEDMEKPTWDDDIDIGDIMPSGDDGDEEPLPTPKKKKKKDKKKKKKKSGGDDAGVDADDMDADKEPAQEEDEEEWDGTEEMRKRKVQEYMDEVYGLEFNDIVSGLRDAIDVFMSFNATYSQVGGMPTRFKYMPVEAQTFSLTPAEILTATNQELNQYMSVKKYAPYQKGQPKWDKNRGEKLKELKQKVGERMGNGGAKGADNAANGAADQKKRRKGRKERMKEKDTTEEKAPVDLAEAVAAPEPVAPVHGKRKREEEADFSMNGPIEKTKKKRRHRKSTAAE